MKNLCMFYFLYSLCFFGLKNSFLLSLPIDIVYTWVDGSDSEWLAIKNSSMPLDLAKAALVNGTVDGRFRDNQELRYSLRSIWQHAPFINHIYIVTMNQRPVWLANHPKVTIIDHKEIFKYKEDLPTFNSQAIESNIHRIPNLSEHFIYLNDDFFLGAEIVETDFFTDGQPHFFLEKKESPDGPAIEGETAYRKAWRNTNTFLNERYRREPRNFFLHSPYALVKSSMELFDREFPFIFKENSSHKFRSTDDYNVTNGLLHYSWLYNNKAIIKKIENIYISVKDDIFIKKTKEKLRILKKIQPKTFCLEDNMEVDFVLSQKLIHDFLEEYFPQAAPWEITNAVI